MANVGMCLAAVRHWSVCQPGQATMPWHIAWLPLRAPVDEALLAMAALSGRAGLCGYTESDHVWDAHKREQGCGVYS